MHDVEARHEAELHRLLGQGECARDERLRGDDGRDRRERDHRIEERWGHERVERPVERTLARGAEAARIGTARQQERALPEVVEEERGKHDGVPREADRPPAEVSHVRVERLAAGDAQHDRAEDEKAVEPVHAEKARGVRRHERGEDRGLRRDPRRAGGGDAHEPHERRRPEHGADVTRPAPLDEKESGEDRDRHRQHPGRERRRRHLESLDGAEDGDRGRDDAVAVEEGGAEEAERDQPRRRVLRRPQEGEEREDAAFTVIVGAHDEREVLDDDDQQQRPEDERQHAEHVLGARRDAVLAAKALLERVERRGADVAVDDAEGTEPERREARAAYAVVAARRRVLLGGGRGGGSWRGSGIGRHEATTSIVNPPDAEAARVGVVRTTNR